MKNKEKIYSMTALFLIFDQIIKLFIKTKMNLLDQIKVIPNFFFIFYIENKGAAFSILEGQRIFLILISFIILFIIDRYITKENIKDKHLIVYYGMIIAGILGNLIDRLLYDGVIDYLAFKIFGYDFPVFNLADICIVVGVILLIIREFIIWRKSNDRSRIRK